MSSRVSAALRRQVFERAQGLCEYCLIDQKNTAFGCELEHIVSEKHRGATTSENLAVACFFCNRFKGSDIATLSESGSLTRLFNPRQDNWWEHFQLDGARLAGLTDIGNATATLLCFNVRDRILERESLIKNGRYPSLAARQRMSAQI